MHMSTFARLFASTAFFMVAPQIVAVAAPAPAPAAEIEIVVEGGDSPARVEVVAGKPARLRFLRREYTGCTREVVFPSLGIRRELPPNRPVVIELPATLAPGEYEFKCGMNMIRGTLVVVAPGG
jgi:plastocyanin domain-containing protein